MLSSSNARLVAARRLTRRKHRREAGRFLAEGAQAVREAIAAGAVDYVFATAEALDRYTDMFGDVRVDEISSKDADELSETVTPQGLVAVCRMPRSKVSDVLARRPRLVATLIEPNDPGNLGTIVRTADAAGADAVIVVGGADVYNGKSVRASAGSLFHLDVIVQHELGGLLDAAREAGLSSLATSGRGARDLDEFIASGECAEPTMWLFGAEAHGLPDEVLKAADTVVCVPIHGRAESLNVAAAAAVCLYASARAQRAR
jgi:TrmH family RNA methyltransferase